MCRAAAGVFARLLRPVCFLYYITFCPGLQGLTPGFLSVHEDFSFLLGLLRGARARPPGPLGAALPFPAAPFFPAASATPCCTPPFLPHLPIFRHTCNFPPRFPSLSRLQTPRPPSFCSAFRADALCRAFPALLLCCGCSRSYKIVWTGMVSRKTTSQTSQAGVCQTGGPDEHQPGRCFT